MKKNNDLCFLPRFLFGAKESPRRKLIALQSERCLISPPIDINLHHTALLCCVCTYIFNFSLCVKKKYNSFLATVGIVNCDTYRTEWWTERKKNLSKLHHSSTSCQANQIDLICVAKQAVFALVFLISILPFRCHSHLHHLARNWNMPKSIIIALFL